jgi:hypothetical protein
MEFPGCVCFKRRRMPFHTFHNQRRRGHFYGLLLQKVSGSLAVGGLSAHGSVGRGPIVGADG